MKGVVQKSILLMAAFLLTVNTAHSRAALCKQFNDQAEAQKYFDTKRKGWRRLDRDKDGEACECLIGGSAYTKPVCKRWRKKNNKR